jgi:hypothetical protein
VLLPALASVNTISPIIVAGGVVASLVAFSVADPGRKATGTALHVAVTVRAIPVARSGLTRRVAIVVVDPMLLALGTALVLAVAPIELARGVVAVRIALAVAQP